MLALTDEQLKQIMTAAAMVSPSDRQNFLRSVASQLTHQKPSDGEVVAALVWVLQNRNISVTPELFLNCPLKGKLKCEKPQSTTKTISKTAS